MYAEKSSYRPLSGRDVFEDIPSSTELKRARRKIAWTQKSVRLPIVLSICLLQLLLWVVTVGVFIYIQRSDQPPAWLSAGPGIVRGYYPAAEAVAYEEKVFVQENIYKTRHGSAPSNATDAAWEELLEPTDGLIQASYETGFDISRLPHTAQSKVDPSMNLYGLEVHHQLHCLNRVRKSFYPEHYFPNEDEEHVVFHREHCIEHLRQSILCSGDIALDYWEWDDEDHTNYLKTDVTHMCRRFDKLSDWVRQHQYRLESWVAPKVETILEADG